METHSTMGQAGIFTLLCLFILLSPSPGKCEGSLPQAKRIVSLGPLNTENVYLLGAGDRLVGDTSYCVRPEAARHKEKIGSVMQVSIEKIISLKPDLILATALTRPEQLKQLQNLGLRVVRFRQPASFKEICGQFSELGQLLGATAEARRIIDQARGEVEAVQRKVAHLPRKKVFLQVGTRPLFASLESSFTHDFIALAGGLNIAADQRSGVLNPEKVIAADPDLIVIAIMGSETGIAGEEKEKWQRMPVLKAARAGRVHVLDPASVCSPSPMTFARTLGIIAALIHPEIDQRENR
ncbi:ABC transporter substrate-binding protein [Thiovibrio sp. JS02]